jgi:hypothetical protein
MKVDISGLPKHKVLAAIYNHAQPMGMGFLRATRGDMTEDEAKKILGEEFDRDYVFAGGVARKRNNLYFDYLNGRCMKVDITNDEVNSGLFDRDYGEGALAKVIAKLRAEVQA